MGALDRDYWKEPQSKNINPTNKHTTKKNNKFTILISEYNKNVSFLNRYIKISDLILWNIIFVISIIFAIIFLAI